MSLSRKGSLNKREERGFTIHNMHSPEEQLEASNQMSNSSGSFRINDTIEGYESIRVNRTVIRSSEMKKPVGNSIRAAQSQQVFKVEETKQTVTLRQTVQRSQLAYYNSVHPNYHRANFKDDSSTMTDGLSLDKMIGQTGPTYYIRCTWQIKKVKVREANEIYINRNMTSICYWRLPLEILSSQINNEVIEWNIQPSKDEACFWSECLNREASCDIEESLIEDEDYVK